MMEARSQTMMAAAIAACLGFAEVALARDQVSIAGSSTVLPYANFVAAQFAKTFATLKAALVAAGGTGAGLKQFCIGLGESTVDIVNASRPLRTYEVAACQKAGVKEIIEVKFGYDGIVFASDFKGPS